MSLNIEDIVSPDGEICFEIKELAVEAKVKRFVVDCDGESRNDGEC